MFENKEIRTLDDAFSVSKRLLVNNPYLGSIHEHRDRSDILEYKHETGGSLWDLSTVHECGCEERRIIKRALYGLRVKSCSGSKIKGIRFMPECFHYNGAVAFLQTKLVVGKQKFDDEVGIYVILDDVDVADNIGQVNRNLAKSQLASNIAEHYSPQHVRFFSFLDLLSSSNYRELAFFGSTVSLRGRDFEICLTELLEERINITIEAAYRFFGYTSDARFRVYKELSVIQREDIENMLLCPPNNAKSFEESVDEIAERLKSRLLCT